MRSFKLERKKKNPDTESTPTGAQPGPGQGTAPPSTTATPPSSAAAPTPPPGPPPPAPPAAETDRQALRAAAEREALARLDQAEQRGAPAPSRADPEVSAGVEAEAEHSAREIERMHAEVEERIAQARADAEERIRAAAEESLKERRSAEEELARALVETEDRLAARQRDTASALERAVARLDEVEARAAEAEERARRAERLAAIQAGAAPVPPAESASEPSGPGAEPDRPAGSDQPLSINSATYEDLRTLGMSVTQTGRVLAHRERVGGFRSLDDLDEIPGFEAGFLEVLKVRLRI